MSKEIEISPKQISKAIQNLLDENEHLKQELKAYQQMYFDKVLIINKALEYINKDYSIMESNEIIRLEEILRGETHE